MINTESVKLNVLRTLVVMSILVKVKEDLFWTQKENPGWIHVSSFRWTNIFPLLFFLYFSFFDTTEKKRGRKKKRKDPREVAYASSSPLVSSSLQSFFFKEEVVEKEKILESDPLFPLSLEKPQETLRRHLNIRSVSSVTTTTNIHWERRRD